MGCCNCSLRTSAIVAAVFGLIESFCSVIGAAFIADAFSPSSVRRSISSTGGSPVESVINPNLGYSTFRAVALSHLTFNIIWFVSTLLLVTAIVDQIWKLTFKSKHVILHRQWTFVTSIVTLTDAILLAVACAELNMDASEFFNNVRLIILIILISRGLSLYVVNLFLGYYVFLRGNEILFSSHNNATSDGQQMQQIRGQLGYPEPEMNVPYNPQYI